MHLLLTALFAFGVQVLFFFFCLRQVSLISKHNAVITCWFAKCSIPGEYDISRWASQFRVVYAESLFYLLVSTFLHLCALAVLSVLSLLFCCIPYHSPYFYLSSLMDIPLLKHTHPSFPIETISQNLLVKHAIFSVIYATFGSFSQAAGFSFITDRSHMMWIHKKKKYANHLVNMWVTFA